MMLVMKNGLNAFPLVPVCLVVAGACGSSQPSTTSATSPSAPEATETEAEASDTGEGIAWADKTREQKIAVMKTQVMPAAQEIWKQSPNPEEEVNCATCHGANAEKGIFSMPTTGIPALNPADQFAAHADEAEWLQFMSKSLVPTMAKVLDVAPYDPATQKGFGCFACHTMVGN
jgi:hypothetical protein